MMELVSLQEERGEVLLARALSLCLILTPHSLSALYLPLPWPMWGHTKKLAVYSQEDTESAATLPLDFQVENCAK